MKRLKLVVEKRKVLGKQVRKLRKEGILPANIYGKDMKSLAVQLPYKDFEKVFKETGETGLVDIEVEGSAKPVLIHNVQRDHITKKPIHADFFQVNLKEKVKTMIPLEVLGEPKAVTEKIGLLLQPLSEVEVEALPEDLPEKIEVNVENLANVDEQITVADLKLPKGVEVLTDPSQIIVKISELVTKEAQEEAAAEAAAAAEAKVEEGEAQAPTEEGTKPESSSAEATADKEEPQK
ncbi:50S ribosomal protein L25 [Candidatus Microgenomates bacterium]|nr:MAG: 50S ribosomal protein L25 [Candidatus Microgenomates bacterium]